MYASTKCGRGTGVVEENGRKGRVERKQRKGQGREKQQNIRTLQLKIVLVY